MGSLIYDEEDLNLTRLESLDREWVFPAGSTIVRTPLGRRSLCLSPCQTGTLKHRPLMAQNPISQAPQPVGPMTIPKNTQHTPAEVAEIANARMLRQLRDESANRRDPLTGRYGSTSMTRALGRRSTTRSESPVDIRTILADPPGNGTRSLFYIASHDPSPLSPPPLPPFAMSPELGLSPTRGRDRTRVGLSPTLYAEPVQASCPPVNHSGPPTSPIVYEDPFAQSPSPTGQSPTPSIMYGPPQGLSQPELLGRPWAEPECLEESHGQLQSPAQIAEPGPSQIRERRDRSPTDPFLSTPSPRSSSEFVDNNHDKSTPPQVHMPTLALLTGSRESPLLGRRLSFDLSLTQEDGERTFGNEDEAPQTPTELGHDICRDVNLRLSTSGIHSPSHQSDLETADPVERDVHINRPESFDFDAMIEELGGLHQVSQLPSPIGEQTIYENEIWCPQSTSTQPLTAAPPTSADAFTPGMAYPENFPALPTVPRTDPSTLLSPDSVDADSPLPYTPGPTHTPFSHSRKEKWRQHSSQFGGPHGRSEPSEGEGGERGPGQPEPAQ